VKPISRLRFDALAGYARRPETVITAEELGYFEHADERVLGILIRDRTDNDFAGMVLARDELLQYRWTRMTDFEPTERRARAMLRPALEQAAMAPDEEHHQGHKKPKPVDFFTPAVPPERLNPNFRALIEDKGFAPARGIIEPMMRWYKDVDGNFIEQFQTTGFDARLWELYLFAALVEMSFLPERPKQAPDFIATSVNGQIAIEAATVNPTLDKDGKPVPPPPLDKEEDLLPFLRDYMPIKFGSTLYSKLAKEYWAKEHVRGLPFAIAVQDFSFPGSMIMTRPALQLYLYGYDQDTVVENGKTIVHPRRVTQHKWNDKEIPSGFFFLPGAENVSAVLFSNSGTISKFNRVGFLAGFARDGIKMLRTGYAYQNPEAGGPEPFERDVADAAYRENWVEGLDVYHNPRAAIPIDPRHFPGAAHHRLLDSGVIESRVPRWHPVGSRTIIAAKEKQLHPVG
jgi:hypothetical protein